ncbi:MAG: response regulator transcription factor [Spirochaetales bacterium]|nr:response regulator transcription factor [Spirochaetales bacterium]
MAFSIVIIVFFYGFFSRDFNEKQRKSRTITIADLNAYHISEREFSVIQLVSQGLTNKEIASELNISVNTVNNHVANIFSKTGVRSRIDLLNLLRELNK